MGWSVFCFFVLLSKVLILDELSIMLRHLINLVLSILPPSRFFGLRYLLWRIAGVNLARGVKFCGRGWIYGRGSLSIAERTWLSPGVVFHTNIEAEIRLGSDCDIGPGVEFVLGSHAIGGEARRAGQGVARPILVGNGCWIGAKSLILGGVTIGDGAIIAAGSVVVRDVPKNTLVAGVPSIVKRQLQ